MNRILSVVIVMALMFAVTAVGISYGRALAYPGDASVAVRTVDWARDHGGGPVVDAVENWWYSRHRDTSTSELVSGGTSANAPTPLARLGPQPMAGDGEGTWESLPTGRDGERAGYATFLRSDPEHPEVRVGVARFDQRLVSTRLVAGTKQPVLDPAPGRGEVPVELRSRLVATFNSGYKAIDSNGGYLAGRRQLRPLREGAASAVIDDTGRLTVG